MTITLLFLVLVPTLLLWVIIVPWLIVSISTLIVTSLIVSSLWISTLIAIILIISTLLLPVVVSSPALIIWSTHFYCYYDLIYLLLEKEFPLNNQINLKMMLHHGIQRKKMFISFINYINLQIIQGCFDFQTLIQNYNILPPIDTMDSQQQHSESQQQQFQIDVVPLQDKYQKVLTLNNEVRQEVQNLTKNVTKKPLLNSHIDPKNQARPFVLQVMRENIQFKNFMTKKKNQSKKKEAFQAMREILEEKGYQNIANLSDRQQRAVMVVRFINKVQNQPNVMQIEDDLSKQREKIVVKQGIVYVGLICAIEAVYENQMYRLQKIIDLSAEASTRQSASTQLIINHPPSAYRILMTKGPFWRNDGKQNIGIQLIVNQLENLRYKENIRVDLLIVMGPILSLHNENVKNCTLDKTFEEEADVIIETLKGRVEKILPSIQILMIPSTDDATSMYPMPQPQYDLRTKTQLKFGSNPCTFRLESSKQQCKLNLINYDLIHYIDESKCGRSIKQPLIENIETYLKQPFLITNTLDDSPFDETNFSGLFNRGEFGNVIVMSSQRHPAFAHKVKGNKIFVNIGSLGVDYHALQKHFMTLMSIYDGQGDVSERIKIDSIIM